MTVKKTVICSRHLQAGLDADQLEISQNPASSQNLIDVADIWNYVICSGSIIKNYRRDNGKAFTDNVYNSSKIKPADEADEEVVTAEGEIMEKAAN